MSINRYEGDPKIVVTENGADMLWRGGQPVMDQGTENPALMRLFTKTGWVGNFFIRDVNQQVGTDFQDTAQSTITVSSLVTIQDAADKALQNLVDSGMASKIITRAANPTGKITEVAALIQPPGKDIEVLLVTKFGSKWIAQKEDPAYRRL